MSSKIRIWDRIDPNNDVWVCLVCTISNKYRFTINQVHDNLVEISGNTSEPDSSNFKEVTDDN